MDPSIPRDDVSTLRRHLAGRLDVILMHATARTWTFKRDARLSRPLREILWTRDGIAYLRPEVQLLHKARATRPKDQVDFDQL